MICHTCSHMLTPDMPLVGLLADHRFSLTSDIQMTTMATTPVDLCAHDAVVVKIIHPPAKVSLSPTPTWQIASGPLDDDRFLTPASSGASFDDVQSLTDEAVVAAAAVGLEYISDAADDVKETPVLAFDKLCNDGATWTLTTLASKVWRVSINLTKQTYLLPMTLSYPTNYNMVSLHNTADNNAEMWCACMHV